MKLTNFLLILALGLTACSSWHSSQSVPQRKAASEGAIGDVGDRPMNSLVESAGSVVVLDDDSMVIADPWMASDAVQPDHLPHIIKPNSKIFIPQG